jgi:hypothetical protein
MVDVASMVIAALSCVGTLAIGAVGLLYTWSPNERKHRSEAETLVAKYRDPLLLTVQDLRSRIYGLLDLELAEFCGSGYDEQDNLQLYTLS